MHEYLLNSTSEGTGRNLILIHGVAGSLRIWDRVVPHLTNNYAVHRLDSLGYGHSPKPHISYTPQIHVEAIRRTLQSRHIKPPYTLVGLSMGVNLALEYAARWPDEVEGFIGIGFPYYADEAAARKGLHNDFWTRITIERPVLARIITPPIWWLGQKGILPTQKFAPIYTQAMARDALRNPHYVFRSTLHECMLTNNLDPLLAASGDMDRLFIHGADDTWSTVDDVRAVLETYPKSALVVIPGTEHNTVVVNPVVTADHITGYLKNH